MMSDVAASGPADGWVVGTKAGNDKIDTITEH